MDGSTASEESLQQLSPSPSPGTLESPFNPTLHSWIFVPDADDLLCGSTDNLTSGVHSTPALSCSLGVATSAIGGESEGSVGYNRCVSTSASPPPSPAPPSLASYLQATTLSNSVIEESEAVAALMISEILGNTFPITSNMSTPQLSASPIAMRELHDVPIHGVTSYSADDWVQADCIDAAMVEELFGARAQEQECAHLDDDGTPLPRPLTWARYISTQPLALVAVLLASHAAAFLLGLAIGRGSQGMDRRAATDCALQRRFSSGPYGYHARLCVPA